MQLYRRFEILYLKKKEEERRKEKWQITPANRALEVDGLATTLTRGRAIPREQHRRAARRLGQTRAWATASEIAGDGRARRRALGLRVLSLRPFRHYTTPSRGRIIRDYVETAANARAHGRTHVAGNLVNIRVRIKLLAEACQGRDEDAKENGEGSRRDARYG